MKSFFYSHFFGALLLLVFHTAICQTPSERIRIKNSRNDVAYTFNADSAKKSFRESKRKALELAQQKGWVIRKETKDQTIALMGITKNGHPIYYTTNNVNAAATTSTNKLYVGAGLGYDLDGSDMMIGEWDAGSVRTTHQEFNTTGSTRITNMDTTASYDHSTHVAGTLIAGGAVANAKGMACNASLESYDWDEEMEEMEAAAIEGMLISNHSYGILSGWNDDGTKWHGDAAISETEDYKFGYYGYWVREWDRITYENPYYLVCKSAGNDRDDGDDKVNPDGGEFGYDCITYYGNAKNILTVGAVGDLTSGYTGDPGDVNMSSFSSWGPTDDGRIKPDIVGNGVGVYSSLAGSDTQYASYNGTSMATPNVAGSLLLLQEHYKNNHDFYMKAATLKGLAIHTADEAGDAEGPDYEFGWGLFNAYTAAEVISDENTSSIISEASLAEGETYAISVQATGTEPLIATICWTDMWNEYNELSLNSVKVILENDLDMTITNDQKKQSWQPYVLDGTNPSNAATTGDNDLDNVEKIYIANPIAGNYTISINHEGTISYGPQDFSLIVTGVTNVAKPEVNTFAVQNITSITALAQGEIISSGDSDVISHGICFSTHTMPDLTDNHTAVYSSEVGSFTSDLSNLAPNTTFYIRAYATNAIGTTYGNEESFTTLYGVLSWSGNTSTDWNTASNWSGSTVPSSGYNVEIPNVTNIPVIGDGQEASVHNLTIQSDAALTVNGSLDYDGLLTIESDATSTGSLIVVGTIESNGNTSLARYVNNNNSWHFLSAPVSAQQIQSGFIPAEDPLPQDFDFYYFDETATNGLSWINIRGSESVLNENFETTFTLGRGYLVAYDAVYDTDLAFSGQLNVADFDTVLTYSETGAQGWNLIGNPFAAAIDWSAVDKSGLSNLNYYVYDNTANGGAGDYVYHNGSNGTTTGYISPNQGFFVKVDAANSFSLPVSALAHSDQNFLKSNNLPDDILTLEIANEIYSDEVFISIHAASQFEEDRLDAMKLFSFNSDCPAIYAFTSDHAAVAFNNIPQLSDTTVIDLGTRFPVAANYTISLAASGEVFSHSGIYLEDAYNAKIIDLSVQPEYTFDAIPSDENRFRLHLNNQTIGVDENELSDVGVNIWTNSNQIIIDKSIQKELTYQVFNMLGQTITSGQMNAMDAQIIIPVIEKGVYLVSIQNQKICKVIIQ